MVDPKYIGKTYPQVKYEVGLEKVKEYAQAIGDNNPLYLNEEEAAKSPYGGIIAPPTFAVVYQKEMAGQMLFDKELDLNFAMLVHGEQEFEFHKIVKPGDVVYTEGKVLDIQRKEDKDIVTFECESKVNSELVTTGRYTFVVRE